MTKIKNYGNNFLHYYDTKIELHGTVLKYINSEYYGDKLYINVDTSNDKDNFIKLHKMIDEYIKKDMLNNSKNKKIEEFNIYAIKKSDNYGRESIVYKLKDFGINNNFDTCFGINKCKKNE